MEISLAAIVNNFDKQIAELICRKVNHEDCCHDIQQEVYIRIMQNIDKVEKAENIKSYLLKIADNAVTDHYRKKEKRPYDAVTENIALEDQSVIDEPQVRLADCCLRPMIDSLESMYRDALISTELEGLTHKQYAEKAAISYTNAKTRVQRAKQKLKEIILNCCSYEFDRYGNIVSCQKRCCNN